MDNDRVMLTPEQAESMLAEGDTVHTFLNPGGILLGADWNRQEAVDLIKSSHQREIGGSMCQSMGHELVVWRDEQTPVYMATKTNGE